MFIFASNGQLLMLVFNTYWSLGDAAWGVSDKASLELNLAICVKKESILYEAITRKYCLNQQIRKKIQSPGIRKWVDTVIPRRQKTMQPLKVVFSGSSQYHTFPVFLYCIV